MIFSHTKVSLNFWSFVLNIPASAEVKYPLRGGLNFGILRYEEKLTKNGTQQQKYNKHP